ncbi:MAG TPA: zf-HC2 domain-containing protein, partial [Archangium sp.]|nr:zf-HC2 domain-containing protein [Archangium sp.]
MAGNPACERFIPLLSPYIDGELAPTERVNVERHLSACKACTGRTADLRAESGLLRVGLDMAVDEVDFKDFAQKVMARVTPERPPLLERWRLSLSELFLYHRTAMVSSLATAAVLALVVVPLVMNQDDAPMGYGADRMR